MGERAGHGFAGFPRGADLLNRASSIVPGGGLKVVLAERDVRFFSSVVNTYLFRFPPFSGPTRKCPRFAPDQPKLGFSPRGLVGTNKRPSMTPSSTSLLRAGLPDASCARQALLQLSTPNDGGSVVNVKVQDMLDDKGSGHP